MSSQAKEVKKADKLLKDLEVLVNPTKTPKPKLAEIEAVFYGYGNIQHNYVSLYFIFNYLSNP